MTSVKITAHTLRQLNHQNYRSLKRLGRREITVCPADSSTDHPRTWIIRLKIRRNSTTGDLSYEVIPQEQLSDNREISSTNFHL